MSESPTPQDELESLRPEERRGMIAWMARNAVTANLLMIFLICGGLWSMTSIKQEVFPEFAMDYVNVSVSYPGASPEEVEQGILLPVEASIQGINGIKEIRSTARENSGTITIELYADVDQEEAQRNIEQAVSRIRTFPEEAERPTVNKRARRREVLDLLVYGDAGEAALREVAENVRDRLLNDERITQVDVESARGFEIHVELDDDALRKYDLTLARIAQIIRTSSVDRPAGKLETDGGELLVRVSDRKDWSTDYAQIPIVQTETGGLVRLGEIAKVREGFAESRDYETYNGDPAMTLEVYRVGDQTPVGVSEAVHEIMEQMESTLPDGIEWAVNNDRSIYYDQRRDLLVRNTLLGLVIVMVLLGLFLDLRVAFWVTMGIPVSFIGAVLFLPTAGVSINIISLFAFIIALGIVVDDALVAGENIHEQHERGVPGLAGAIRGAREVAGPITFSILSNIVAFLPLFFVPGVIGKIWQVIPVVVITVFIISWVESLLILPAHLAHAGRKRGAHRSLLSWVQGGVQTALDAFIHHVYARVVRLTVRYRMLTMASAFAVLAVVFGYSLGGHIGMVLMPRVESDFTEASARLPAGTPKETVDDVAAQLVAGIEAVAEENGGENLVKGTLARINGTSVRVRSYLTDPRVRPKSTTEVTDLWREKVGTMPKAPRVRYSAESGGPGGGAALTIELSHSDVETLDRAGLALAAELREFPNIKDVDDGYVKGKDQVTLRLNEAGMALGLDSATLSREVRSAYFGAEAVRQLRMSDEVKVLVRRPESERDSIADIESLMVMTPAGTRVPLREVASIEEGKAFRSIARRNGKRTTTVTADVKPIGETQMVMETLKSDVFPQLWGDFPGLTTTFRGRQSSMRESTDALFQGLLIAFIAIYFLLAIPFRSYLQPLVVMTAIPFGAVGAVMGHWLMDYNLSLISLMGMVALSGIVVNDSLVLVDYANRQRREHGLSAREAIELAALRRFRPVLLTTLTTFGGLAPMIFETSRQARFMIPMALSLGFGILFATLIVLIIVPAMYVLIDDLQRLLNGLGRRLRALARGELRSAPAELDREVT